MAPEPYFLINTSLSYLLHEDIALVLPKDVLLELGVVQKSGRQLLGKLFRTGAWGGGVQEDSDITEATAAEQYKKYKRTCFLHFLRAFSVAFSALPSAAFLIHSAASSCAVARPPDPVRPAASPGPPRSGAPWWCRPRTARVRATGRYAPSQVHPPRRVGRLTF